MGYGSNIASVSTILKLAVRRLDALEFKPTKSQRKLINRFNRWVLYGDDHGDKKPKCAKFSSLILCINYQRTKLSHKGKANDAFVLEEAIHQAERRVAYRKGDSDSDSRPEHFLEVRTNLLREFRYDDNGEPSGLNLLDFDRSHWNLHLTQTRNSGCSKSTRKTYTKNRKRNQTRSGVS